MDDDAAIRQALRTVRTKLGRKRPMAQSLNQEVRELETAEQALQALLPDDVVEAEPTDSSTATDPLSIPIVNPRPSSAEAVRAILRDHADQAVNIDFVRSEMAKRGWTDPDWKAPEAAVYAALKRLTDRDEQVVRVARRAWMFTTKAAEDLSAKQATDDAPTLSDSM